VNKKKRKKGKRKGDGSLSSRRKPAFAAGENRSPKKKRNEWHQLSSKKNNPPSNLPCFGGEKGYAEGVTEKRRFTGVGLAVLSPMAREIAVRAESLGEAEPGRVSRRREKRERVEKGTWQFAPGKGPIAAGDRETAVQRNAPGSNSHYRGEWEDGTGLGWLGSGTSNRGRRGSDPSGAGFNK